LGRAWVQIQSVLTPGTLGLLGTAVLAALLIRPLHLVFLQRRREAIAVA
jgi:hypothetical protein